MPPKPTPHSLLLGGPYHAPQVMVGGALFCSIRGERTVTDFTMGRIPWPIGCGNQPFHLSTPVACGDLLKALKLESVAALCYWFGLKPAWVTKIRCALGIPRYTPGTKKLRNAVIWKANVKGALARQKISEKAKAWWTPKKVALLGKFDDSTVALRLKCGMTRVYLKRMELGIPACDVLKRPSKFWTPKEDKIVARHMPLQAIRHLPGRSLVQIQWRRKKLIKAGLATRRRTGARRG